jgi:FkbM family methyltransferase
LPILQKLPKKFNFLDLGAYDGDTLELFFKKAREVDKEIDTYIAFEPATELFIKLTERVKKLKGEGFKGKSFLFKQACGDSYRHSILTNFDLCPTIVEVLEERKEENSSTKEEFIEIVPPDDVINNCRIDLIKMDVEGFELNCLKGLKEIIQTYKPILEISIYHRPEDIYEIPEFIESLNIDYDMYIRTHHDWYIETVLYCLPNNK